VTSRNRGFRWRGRRQSRIRPLQLSHPQKGPRFIPGKPQADRVSTGAKAMAGQGFSSADHINLVASSLVARPQGERFLSWRPQAVEICAKMVAQTQLAALNPVSQGSPWDVPAALVAEALLSSMRAFDADLTYVFVGKEGASTAPEGDPPARAAGAMLQDARRYAQLICDGLDGLALYH
jgi:hypothetical protein